MRTQLLVTVAAAAVLLAACGGDDPTLTDEAGQSGTSDEATSGTAADPDEGATVTVDTEATDLGLILVDGEGRTLYLFDNDTEGVSTCSGSCADTWPPLTGGEASASGDVDPALLGTTERDDGSAQVTYGGWPLYLYAGDAGPGDTEGQGVGDVWWVISPEGERVTGEAKAETKPADAYDY